jgi:hypothetical protein
LGQPRTLLTLPGPVSPVRQLPVPGQVGEARRLAQAAQWTATGARGLFGDTPLALTTARGSVLLEQKAETPICGISVVWPGPIPSLALTHRYSGHGDLISASPGCHKDGVSCGHVRGSPCPTKLSGEKSACCPALTVGHYGNRQHLGQEGGALLTLPPPLRMAPPHSQLFRPPTWELSLPAPPPLISRESLSTTSQYSRTGLSFPPALLPPSLAPPGPSAHWVLNTLLSLSVPKR